jgi:hypothetical protein
VAKAAAVLRTADAESTAFWPVYQDYARDQLVIGSGRVLIKDYAKNYDSLDDKAKDMVHQCAAVRQYPSDSVANACA